MRTPLTALVALVFTGAALAAQDMDAPPAPPVPPAPPSVALAPPPPPPPLGGPEMVLGPGGRALRDLDLSAEQRTQIRALTRGARDRGLAQAGESLRAARQALERALWDPDLDEAGVAALRAAAAEAEDRMFAVRRQTAGEILKLLTEEQRAELLQALDETPAWGPPRR